MNERLFKVMVVGENHCGKTSFVKRYVHNVFSAAYKATIGLDFALKVLSWEESTTVRLQLWDIAGQQRYSNTPRSDYRGAVGAFVAFDATNPRTFDCVLKWKEELDHLKSWDGSQIPVILIMNKCDLNKYPTIPSTDELHQFAAKHGFAHFYETSAKEPGHQVFPSFFIYVYSLYSPFILMPDSFCRASPTPASTLST
jgi:small GTP-binding protein